MTLTAAPGPPGSSPSATWRACRRRRRRPSRVGVAADHRPVGAELARVRVMLLHGHVLEPGAVLDDQLDHGVDVGGRRRAVLLEERRGRVALEHDQHPVIRGAALRRHVERPHSAAARPRLRPARGARPRRRSGRCSRLQTSRRPTPPSRAAAQQVGPGREHVRDPGEGDAVRRVAGQLERAAGDGERLRVESAQVREPPRLLAVRRHRQRLVGRPGSLTAARQPGGLRHRLHLSRGPSISPPHGSFHLELDQPVHLDRVLQRQLLGDRLDEARHHHRGGLGPR